MTYSQLVTKYCIIKILLQVVTSDVKSTASGTKLEKMRGKLMGDAKVDMLKQVKSKNDDVANIPISQYRLLSTEV